MLSNNKYDNAERRTKLIGQQKFKKPTKKNFNKAQQLKLLKYKHLYPIDEKLENCHTISMIIVLNLLPSKSGRGKKLTNALNAGF